MELHQLKYFCAIADTGSFSRAAQQAHVSQPALSQQIAKLEDELGTQLFDRLGRSVRLTELGKTFLPRARAILHDLESARSDIVEKKTSITGSISIGVIPTIAPYFLPPVLATFSQKYPEAQVTIAEEITPLLLERLRVGTMDVAIVALPLHARSHDFQSFPLLVEKTICSAAEGTCVGKTRHGSRSTSCRMIPFSCCAMAIASAKPRSQPANELI